MGFPFSWDDASELFSALVGINVKVVRDQTLCNKSMCQFKARIYWQFRIV